MRFLVLSFLTIIAFAACKREPVPSTTDTQIIVTPSGDTIYITNTDTIYIINPSPMVGHPCSPDTVYFEQQIMPMLQSNCAMPTCHDNITHKEGIWLTSYENVLTTGGVKLSSPTQSKLYSSTSPNAGGDIMPPSPRAPLTTEQRALLLKWIQQGAQDLHCDGACDTTQYSYTAFIKPILALRCNGCHGSSSPSGNLNYTNYAGVKASVNTGKFWASIIHASNAKPMPYPQGSASIPDCDKIKIMKWIASGAPEN